MDISRQNRTATGAGFNRGAVYRMTNGGEIIPLEVWERPFDGAILVSYRARAKGEKTWAEGDSTAATIAHQIKRA